MMGKGIRYTDEFKQEAVNQVVAHGYPVSESYGVTMFSIFLKTWPVPILPASRCQT